MKTKLDEVQYVYLDFDGEDTAYTNEDLGLDLEVHVQDSCIAADRREAIAAELNRLYAGLNVVFVTLRPENAEYSTVYVGLTNSFDAYGNFAGLAETIDHGNLIRNDNAFVFADVNYGDDDIVRRISHEVDHIVFGSEHESDDGDLSLDDFATTYNYSFSSNYSSSYNFIQTYSNSKGSGQDVHYYTVTVPSGQVATVTVTFDDRTTTYAYGSLRVVSTNGDDVYLSTGNSKTMTFTSSGQIGMVMNVSSTSSSSWALSGHYTIKATYAAIPPDLLFFEPTGWDAAVVTSTTTGTNTNASSYTTNDNIYLDFAFGNAGGDISSTYYVSIYIDGAEYKKLTVSGGTAYGDAYGPEDIDLGKLSAGSHAISVKLDSTGAVSESNESNNTFSKTITVEQGALPDLAPYRPSGWSDALVIAKAAGTTTDASSFTTDDDIYVNFALSNADSATGGPFYVVMYLDGELCGAWEYAAMDANKYRPLTDLSLGKLSAGQHSVVFLIDPLDNVAESDEENNGYGKTFTVTQKAVSADAWEGGNGDGTRFKATKISVGETQSHTIHTATDEDWFVFEVPADGFYSVYTSGGDTVLQLYSFENQAFAYNDDRGNGDRSSFGVTELYANTKYYARVAAKDGGRINYSINLMQGVVQDAFEKNGDGSLENASLLTVGDTQTHTIHSGSDVDWVKFMVEETGRYFFSIGTSDRADGFVSIELYNSAGEAIDISGLNTELYKLSGENPYIAANYGPGMYYVKVTSANGGASGGYTVNLTPVSTFAETNADEYEDDAGFDRMGEIRVGETQTHSLNVWTWSTGETQLDLDLIKFTPSETGTYAIRVSNSEAPTHMTVYVVDDFGLLLPIGGDNRINPFVENYFQAGQTYVIQMENEYLHLNVERYDITVEKTASFVPEKDAYEGDDTRGAARNIALGESQAHSIHAVGDEDWVKFTPSTSGYYTFYTGARNGNAGDPDMRLGLYDASGKLLADDDNSFAIWNAMIAYKLTAGQTYYIQAQAARASTVVPYYTITLARGVIEDSFDIYMDERSVVDNTADTAMRIDYNVPTAHTLHSASDVDWMWFDVTESGYYTLQTTGSGDTYIRLYRYGASGLEDLIAVDDDSGVGKNASITIYLEADASIGSSTYVAEVSSYHGEIIPLYYAMLTKADGGGGDAYEDDDSMSKAKGIVAGETQSRSIHDAGDVDWVLFRPIKAGAYQIQTSGDGDMKLDLYDASGKLLATDDDSGTGLNARIGQTLAANTNYYIRVYAYKPDVTIAGYGLNVSLLQTSELGDEYENDDDPAKAKAIRLGETQTHSIHTAGDVDWITFTPTKGGEYTIQTTGSGLNCDTRLYIYRSLSDAQAGRYLKWDDDGGTDRNAKITIRLDVGNTYYIKAQAWEDYTIPTYGLKVTFADGDEYEDDNLSGNCKPIAVGREYTHSIHAKSDTDWIRFFTHDSGTYTIQTTGEADMSFIVYKRTPGGPLVPYEGGTEISGGGAGNNALYSVYMETDNWYYVRITTTGRQSTAPSYGIRVDYNSTSSRGDAYETAGGKSNDNAPSRASWLTANTSQVHSIHVAGDEDWFAFKTAVAGRYILNLSSLALYTSMYVKNGDGSLSYISRTGAKGTDNAVVVDVKADATYYFKVHGVNASTVVDSYTIALSLPMDGYESDDLSGNASRIAMGQRQSHSLHTSEDVDWVTFDITQAGDYIVKNDNGGAVNMILYKKGASGNTEVGSSTQTATYTGLSSGTYYLRMASAKQSANTGYVVSIEQDVTVKADSYEADNSRSAAKTIAVGANQTHSLHTATDVDYMKFYASAGSAYTVTTAGADLSVQIQNSSGTVVASDSGTGASVYYQVTSSGYYYAQVKSATGETVDSYSVSLSQSTANAAENYVVLFNGGGDAASNRCDFYIHLKNMYLALVQDVGIAPDHIIILSADGTSTEQDQYLYLYRPSSNSLYGTTVDSDYSFATARGTKVMSATTANLKSVVSELAGKMDANDHFMFWCTDHGGDDYRPGNQFYDEGHERVCAWGEDITGTQFNEIFSSLTEGYQSFLFGTCFSGGVLNSLDTSDTSTRKRWGLACAAQGEFGLAGVDDRLATWEWSEVFSGYKVPTKANGVAQLAGDAMRAGVATTDELASYIFANDKYKCSHSYADNGVCDAHYGRDYYGAAIGAANAQYESYEHPWAKGSSFQIFAKA